MKYDVFISYRRTSYESANLIATRLKAEGYRVFFDLESMRSGPFNEQLYTVIAQCKDFVLVLPPDALDRCGEEGDWLRKEIIRALECKKNIIPVMLNGFSWPEEMPEGMENLCMYQALSASPIEYFDLSMKRLEKYLRSRRHTLSRKVVKWSVAVILAICVLMLVVDTYLKVTSIPACSVYVDYMTDQVACVDLLMDSNDKIAKALDEYNDSDKEEFLALLDFHEAEIAALRRCFPDKSVLDEHWDRLFLFGIVESDAQELEMYVSSIADDVLDVIEKVRAYLEMDVIMPTYKRYVSASIQHNSHFANSMYYSYLEVLTRLPEKSLTSYHNAAEDFEYMPATGLGLRESEYQMMIEREFSEVERINAELTAAGWRMRDEVVNAERQRNDTFEALRAEYESYMTRFSVSSSRSADENFANMLLVGNSFLGAAYMEATDPEAEEGDLVLLTPEQVYGDLVCMIDDFLALYPQLGPIVMPVKAYYKEVSELKRSLNGMLCAGYAPDAISYGPLQLGDIVVAINGKPISDFDKATSFMKNKSKGNITYLRLVGDELTEQTCEMFNEAHYLLWFPLIATM